MNENNEIYKTNSIYVIAIYFDQSFQSSFGICRDFLPLFISLQP